MYLKIQYTHFQNKIETFQFHIYLSQNINLRQTAENLQLYQPECSLCLDRCIFYHLAFFPIFIINTYQPSLQICLS